MSGRIGKTVFTLFWVLSLLLSPCTTLSSPSISPTPTPVPSASQELTPPSLFYIADNNLYEQQSGGSTILRAGVGDEGRILDAVRVKNVVILLRENGLQRIEINRGTAKMAARFDRTPLWGELDRAANEDVLLHSIALDSDCSSPGIGGTMGLYQVDQDTVRTISTHGEGYIQPLGLTIDGRSMYGLPLGCDPEFDKFLLISIDQGRITKELPTWDATSKEYGNGYAALSPDAHFLAFLTTRHVEDSLEYRLSVYDLDHLTIERYELPNTPSYLGELLWSPTGQTLYFILNPGTPYDESSESYGLWSLDVHTGIFSPVTSLKNRFMHLVTISSDGKWILLQPETEPNATYIDLATGKQVLMNLLIDGEFKIVR